ncbi:MAG: hypothetical protein M0R77_19875 [Gammaproteobacteria bacterium]|nr:hypothetical protein [Gammaproteobacteria bacterium]
MIILKIIYQGKFVPSHIDALKVAMPLIIEALWPPEYAFENIQIVDEGYSYYRMEDIIYAVGEPNLGQQIVGEKFTYPGDNRKQFVIEYYAYDQHSSTIERLADFIDRLILF